MGVGRFKKARIKSARLTEMAGAAAAFFKIVGTFVASSFLQSETAKA